MGGIKVLKLSSLSLWGGALLLLLSVCPGTISSPSSPPERRITSELQGQIDDFITTVYLPAAQVSGMGLTVVHENGDILYTTGYGMSNIEKGYPNRNITQFAVGSISKSMTSLLVAKVLYETFPDLGAAVLDTPIVKLMPSYNLTLIDKLRSEHSTFRDFLSHLTCVTDQANMAEPFGSLEDMLYRTRYNEELSEIRTFLHYNNQLISMAGYLAGVIAGKPFEEMMEDLWVELGMLNTSFVKRTDNFTDMEFRAMPYYTWDNGEVLLMNPELVKRIIYFNAAGGVFSTLNDISRYLRLHMNRGVLDGKQVIPEEVMYWLITPSFAAPGIEFKESEDDIPYSAYGYGLGLALSSYDGWEMIEHPGNLMNYFSYMSIWPGKKMAVYTGTHQSPIRSDMTAIHLFIYELLTGNPDARGKVIKFMRKMKADEEKRNRKAETNLEKLHLRMIREVKAKNYGMGSSSMSIKLGKYGSGSAGDLEIFERFNSETNQTQYFIEYGKWYHGWLELAEGETSVFSITWVTDAVHDDYIRGLREGQGWQYAGFSEEDDTITIWGSLGMVGVFKFGASRETLPVIPWDPDTC